MLFSTIKSSLMPDPEDQKEAKTELLALSNRDHHASTSLEKPKRGQLPRERSQNFRFSRQDSPAILVSESGTEDHKKTDWHSSTTTLDVEYTHDADTEYPLISPTQQKNLQRKFDKKKQLRKLLWKGFMAWLCSFFLIAMIYLVLNHYSEKHVLSDHKKRWFNSVITSLSLALGFNMAAAFSSMATDMRWWILSRKRRSLREVDLILGCDSMMNVIKLMFIARRPMMILACLSWLGLNLAAQAGVAVLGLTYSIDSGTKYALTTNGNVTSANMAYFYPENGNLNGSQPSNDSQAYTANILGNVALSYVSVNISNGTYKIPSSGMTWLPDTADYYEGEDYWEYVFLDSNPAKGSSAISMYTSRTINASGVCTCNPIAGLDTSNRAGIVAIQDTTSYDISSTCGPRCKEITALEIGSSLSEAWRYVCNITIGYPQNTAFNSTQYVSDAMASIAASAIASNPYTKLQTYPAIATYGTPQKGDAFAMAKLISRFAIGTIVGAAYNNPITYRNGKQPQEGVVLDIDKRKYLSLILFFTAVVQGVCFILSAIVSNRVVVRDDTHLATARLLRPLMERLGRSGSMANGKDISEALGADVPHSHGKHLRVIYSVKHPGKEYLHHLDLGEQKALRKGYPEGTYE